MAGLVPWFPGRRRRRVEDDDDEKKCQKFKNWKQEVSNQGPQRRERMTPPLSL